LGQKGFVVVVVDDGGNGVGIFFEIRERIV
jgi:hypothetical protein